MACNARTHRNASCGKHLSGRSLIGKHYCENDDLFETFVTVLVHVYIKVNVLEDTLSAIYASHICSQTGHQLRILNLQIQISREVNQKYAREPGHRNYSLRTRAMLRGAPDMRLANAER